MSWGRRVSAIVPLMRHPVKVYVCDYVCAGDWLVLKRIIAKRLKTASDAKKKKKKKFK